MPRGRPRKYPIPSPDIIVKKGKRGRPRKKVIPFDWSEPKPPVPEEEIKVASRKFERIFENSYSVSTWTYDLDLFEKGPIQVEIKYKKKEDEIDWGERIKELESIPYRKRKITGQRGRPKK